MMVRSTWRGLSLLTIAAVISSATAIVEGCGSDSFTGTPSTDGGANDGASTGDATPPQDAGGPVVDACVKPPSVATEEQAFCDAYAEISTRCIDCLPCRQTNANGCEALGAALSAPLRDGIV